MYVFTCEKCGGQFYSKVDPSGWRHTVCNKCSGKPYKDIPVVNNTPKPSYGVVSNGITPTKVGKKEFDLDSYIADMLMVYSALKIACDEQRLTIPEENLCGWTTSIMIQKDKAK